MSNLMLIKARLDYWQRQHPVFNVQFQLFVDWSGCFRYADWTQGGKEIEIETFNNFEELERIINYGN